MQKIKEYLESISENQITLSDYQLSQFETYYEMLVERNKVMNLTAITEREDVILKHFIDSVALAGYMNLTDRSLKVIDVGTGAGFPGIPLKIAFPQLDITLFDSLQKRVNFLNEVIAALHLDGATLNESEADTEPEAKSDSGVGSCTAIHGRAEEGGKNRALREQFDLALSRAVANMAVLSEYCIPFVRQGGYFVPYKTEKIDEELNQGKKAVSVLGGKIEKVEKMQLADSDIGRSFVFIKKVKPTPKAYPRKPGTANKQPLM